MVFAVPAEAGAGVREGEGMVEAAVSDRRLRLSGGVTLSGRC